MLAVLTLLSHHVIWTLGSAWEGSPALRDASMLYPCPAVFPPASLCCCMRACRHAPLSCYPLDLLSNACCKPCLHVCLGGCAGAITAGGGAAQAHHCEPQGYAGPSGGPPAGFPQHCHHRLRAAAPLPGTSPLCLSCVSHRQSSSQQAMLEVLLQPLSASVFVCISPCYCSRGNRSTQLRRLTVL